MTDSAKIMLAWYCPVLTGTIGGAETAAFRTCGFPDLIPFRVSDRGPAGAGAGWGTAVG